MKATAPREDCVSVDLLARRYTVAKKLTFPSRQLRRFWLHDNMLDNSLVPWAEVSE